MKTTFNTRVFAVLAIAGLALASALIPGVAEAVQFVAHKMGPEGAMAMSFMGSVAATITRDVAYTGQIPVNAQPRDSGVYEVAIPINFPAAAPVANDTHALVKLIPGVEVIDYTLHLDDVDSNGTPTAALELGELNATLADIGVSYKSGITIGQTGGLVRHAAATAATDLRAIVAATKNNERVLGLKWGTAAATYVASKKGLLVLKLLG